MIKYNKLHLGLFCVLTIICISCESNILDKNIKNIDIVFGQSENAPFSMSQMVDSVFYVQLDSNCNINRIDEMKVVGNKFYLCDKMKGCIDVVNTSGNLISTIQHKGRAKSEYILLSDFDVSSSTDEIHIFDIATHFMLVYSSEGNYKRSYLVNDVIRDFAVMNNGDYLLYTPDYNNDSRRGLWVMDSCFNFKKQLVEIPETFRYGGIYPNYLVHIDDERIGLMAGEYDDNIYTITDDTILTQYHLNFNIDIPQSLTERNVLNYNKHKGELYTKNNYYETLRWLLFNATDMEKQSLCFYDKKNDKKYVLTQKEDLIEDGKALGGEILCSNKDIIVIVQYPEIISKYPNINKIFPNLKQNSSPILEFIKLSK